MLRALVLGMYLLVSLTAIASAWLTPVDSPWVCSSSATRTGGSDGSSSRASALDCPACLPLLAPPPTEFTASALPHELATHPLPPSKAPHHGHAALRPPVRGPPFV